MSRQNKVNPGMYTQRGRLTQDDAARELRKQRAVGSQHTWQPVKKDQLPRLESDDRGDGTETTEDKASMKETSTSSPTRAAARATSSNIAPVKAKTKSATAKQTGRKAKAGAAKQTASKARGGAAKKTTGKSKTTKAATAASQRSAAKPKRKAVLARNVGGGGATPRPTAKRRKS